MADGNVADAIQTTAVFVQEMQATTVILDGKITHLIELYVARDIEREKYLSRKRELMSQKKSAQENILRLERNVAVRLKPMHK